MKIYLLDLGSLVIDRSDVLWHIDVGTPVRFPVYGVYIDHPEGKFIFDTGYDLEHVRAVLPFELPEQGAHQTLPAQLELCGTRPEEIDVYVNSHFHFDHVGGNKYLTNATLVTSKWELRSLLVPEPFERLGYSDVAWYQRGVTKVRFVEGDYELAEGLTLFTTPGHTISHVSLLAEARGPAAHDLRRRCRLHAGDAGQGDHRRLPPRPRAVDRGHPAHQGDGPPARRRDLRLARDGGLGALEARPRVLRGLRRERHMGKLEGRIAIVTGGAQGIGRAIVDKLAAEGATVVIGDIAADSRRRPRRRSPASRSPPTSRSRTRSANLVDTTVDRYGKLDVLVNNAAIVPFTPWDDIDFAEWRRIMRVNLDGTFLVCRAASDAMRRHDYGRIVSIVSNSILAGTPNLAHYEASKGGVFAFTRALATELGKHGITVNSVAPGPDLEREHRQEPACRRLRLRADRSRPSRGAASPPTSRRPWPSWPPRRPAG